ncbi:zinc finger protein 665 [Anabrus simplex]|uniref:zinc finger protein 665 n=1 Tax=Anabrus simplex TaxID=316456 RepID=UPI0035A32B5C
MEPAFEEPEVAKDDYKTGKQLCRLCANTIGDAVYIFDTEEQEGDDLATMINMCLPVTVRRTDRLPKQLCWECVDKLYLCYSFAETSLLAQDKLQALCDSSYFMSWTPYLNNPDKSSCGDNQDKDKFCCPLCYEGSMVVQADDTLLEDNRMTGLLNGCKQELSLSEHWWDTVVDLNATDIEDSSEEGVAGECKVMYSCVLCKQFFPTLAECLEHSSLHAESNMFPCSVCQTCFPDRIQFEYHIKEHLAQGEQLKGSVLVCSLCGCELHSETQFKTHSCFVKLPHAFRCSVCNKSFRTQERLLFHEQFHQGATSLYCQSCAKTFPNEKRHYSHWKFVHKCEKPFSCSECNKTFFKRSLLEAHQRLHTGERPFECNECHKRFHDKPSLRSHIMSHVDSKPFQCDHCGICFVNEAALKKHLLVYKSSCAPETAYKCVVCMEVFISPQVAEEHLRSHVDQTEKTYEPVIISKLFTCEFCDKYFISPSSLNSHREQHNSDTPYECRFCTLCFESYRQLFSHKAGHRSEEGSSVDFRITKMYLCNYCPKEFITYPAMALHLHRLHTYGKPLECIYCDEKFDTYSKISDHWKIHHPPKSERQEPYQCEYCQKYFPVESEKPYRCNTCGKGFSKSWGLNRHMGVHADEEPFSCHLCVRSFKSKGERDFHMRTHSGGRPYKCDVCEKCFKTQTHLLRHRIIHTGERPYKCDVCGKTFIRLDVLREHRRIHTGEKRHSCDLCEKRFHQKQQLLQHKKRRHGAVK